MTKQELKRYRWLVKSNDDLIDRLEKLRAKAERVTHAMSYTPGRGKTESWEDIVAEIADITVELIGRLKAEITLMRRIDKAAAALPDRERAVIEARYIDGKPWGLIATELCYSWRQLHYIHGAALKLLDGK